MHFDGKLHAFARNFRRCEGDLQVKPARVGVRVNDFARENSPFTARLSIVFGKISPVFTPPRVIIALSAFVETHNFAADFSYILTANYTLSPAIFAVAKAICRLNPPV